MNYTKYWLALSRVRGIGPAHLREIHQVLKERDLSISDLLDCSLQEMKEEFGFQDQVCQAAVSAKGMVSSVEGDYERCLDEGIEVVPFFDPSYPERLFSVLGNTFPPFLYSLCGFPILSKRGAAVLGDKDVSEKGELIAYSAARELAAHNLVVFSGYARGVDQIVHRAALEGGGDTAALVPYGLFHHALPGFLEDVFDPEKMAVVSPFYPDREMDQYAAMNRNRIICALSRALYVVEAPADGGIFEAAKSAQHLNVPLFATQYGEYPKNAPGNRIIIDELNGIAVRGRMVDGILTPNMDKIIAAVKFG